jgi:dihydroorotate dehydrogenase
MNYYASIGPALRALPPETAHHLALLALRSGLLPPSVKKHDALLAASHFGLAFASPLGLAAGFDKNACALDGLLAQGFGFVEAGTVTPLPQPGNQIPRLFRLKEDEALINRFGFNNAGVHSFARNLRKRKRQGIVGANIGRNRDSLDQYHDYATCLETVYPHADYIAINISSPNTVGLRDLQQKDALDHLIEAIERVRLTLIKQTGIRKPILYKIAPDLGMSDKQDIAALAKRWALDGLIVANTTIARSETLKSRHAGEKGGLSGAPLFAASTEGLRDMYRLTEGKIPLIGVGGIGNADQAYAKIRAGASLLQIYTAFIYQGFGLLKTIEEGLAAFLRRDGFRHIGEAIGQDA